MRACRAKVMTRRDAEETSESIFCKKRSSDLSDRRELVLAMACVDCCCLKTTQKPKRSTCIIRLSPLDATTYRQSSRYLISIDGQQRVMMAPSDTGKRPETEEDRESGDSTDVFSSDPSDDQDTDATQIKSRRTDSQRKRLVFSKDSSILHIGERSGYAGTGKFKSNIGSDTPVDTKRKRRHMPKIFIYLADIVDAFFIGNLVVISLWSMLCAWLSIRLQHTAEEDPTSTAADWVVWLEGARNPLNLIGTMFIFSLAFRFNQCYSRWWEGRKIYMVRHDADMHSHQHPESHWHHGRGICRSHVSIRCRLSLRLQSSTSRQIGERPGGIWTRPCVERSPVAGGIG